MQTSDHATRTKARELIQIWAMAARNDQKLQSFTSVYEEMKSSGKWYYGEKLGSAGQCQEW
jgi:hypothetical protein